MNRTAPVLLVLLAAACAAPGVDVRPAPSDFAFLEIRLKG
jgi:hypothetical protein